MKQAFLFLTLLFQIFTFAASHSESRLTYDISAGQGRQNGVNYQEINLGLNWFLQDWLIWRNSAFNRSGDNIDSVFGIDSSMRLQQEWLNTERTLGFKIFGGPGVRIASSDSNAAFGEAGVGMRLGGIMLGAGIKNISYFKTRKDKDGDPLPKNENQVFITISGGGSL